MECRVDKTSVTKGELLDGLLGADKRRASVALTLIEARAARFVFERSNVNSPFMTDDAYKERSRDFFRGVAEGVRGHARVTIQDLELCAEAWCSLVPKSPGIRAEIAVLLGQKYRFKRTQIPNIISALRLDDVRLHEAFIRRTNVNVSSIYTKDTSFAEQIRWAWSRFNEKIENLPPFWTAFALTITETVGAGTLALPIAFATIGPLPGVALLVLLGLINLATVAYLAEASARNGSIRYGSAFVGRLVQDYLGTSASILLRIALFAFCCIVLASYYTGFASTLSAITGVPESLWVVIVCGAGLWLILRKSMVGTLASALLIGSINIAILVLLSLVSLYHATAKNLLHMQLPFQAGQAFEPSHFQLVFGVVLVSYFGHLSVSNCAQAVLRRDPEGSSLKWGTIAAMIVAILIYSLWSLSVGGAVGRAGLLGETGTALVPLAEKIGPQIYVPGVMFAVLGLGMSSIHFGLGIVNMSRELCDSALGGLRSAWFGDKTANLVSLVPIALVFAYVQWTYFNGSPSFTAPLELIGAVLTPVLAGIFPVLLLRASRARGLPATGARLSSVATNPLLLVVILFLSFVGLLLHGFVIWSEPVPRAIALLVAVVMLIMMIHLIGSRVFSPRLLVDVRYFPDLQRRAKVTVAFNGRALDLNLVVAYLDGTEQKLDPSGEITDFDRCSYIRLDLPCGAGLPIQIDAHTVTAGNEVENLEGWISFDQEKSSGKPFQALAKKISLGVPATPSGD